MNSTHTEFLTPLFPDGAKNIPKIKPPYLLNFSQYNYFARVDKTKTVKFLAD